MRKNNLLHAIILSSVFFFPASCFASEQLNIESDSVSQVMDSLSGNISVTDATERGKMRWAVWENKIGDSRHSHLALFSMEKNKAKRIWMTSWADTYEPRIDLFTEWTWRNNPIITVHMQMGAAYEHLEFYSLDSNNKPVKLDETDAATSSWVVSNDNGNDASVLVLYKASPVELKPDCYSWDKSAGKLVSKACK